MLHLQKSHWPNLLKLRLDNNWLILDGYAAIAGLSYWFKLEELGMFMIGGCFVGVLGMVGYCGSRVEITRNFGEGRLEVRLGQVLGDKFVANSYRNYS